MAPTTVYENDPDFRAFVAIWIETGTAPWPLSDWLRDRGLEGQAAAVDEAVAFINGRRPCPSRMKAGCVFWVCDGYLTDRSDLPMSYEPYLRRKSEKVSYTIYYTDPVMAIVDYLEAFAAEAASRSVSC